MSFELARSLLYSFVFGSNKFMFDFSKMIDELPASIFFWYYDINPADNLEYRYLLSKLITLFVTPHYLPIYPYEECSYFKKMERYYATTKQSLIMRKHIVNLLGLNPNVLVIEEESSRLSLNNETAEDISVQTLQSIVGPWVADSSAKPILVLPLMTYKADRSEGHANFLALQKDAGEIKFIFINPHGLNPSKVKISTFIQNLKIRLINISGFSSVKQLVTSCPTLQTWEQQGNCVQWSSMIFAFFIIEPKVFDNPLPFLNQLGKHPHLNILLFTMSIFLRTMPFVGLENYYFSLFKIAKMTRTKYNHMLQRCKNDDIIYNRFLFSKFIQTNCGSFDIDHCPLTCRKCDDVCANSFAVKKVDDQCHLLTPKEIAKEMFETYFKIRDLTNHEDTRSFQKIQMDTQLSFEVPSTLQDYVRLGLLNADEILPDQTPETELRQKKRKREQEEINYRVGKLRSF